MNRFVHYCLISHCSCSQSLSGNVSLSHIPLNPHGHSKHRQCLLRELQMSVICFLLLVQNLMINSELLIQRLDWNSPSPLSRHISCLSALCSQLHVVFHMRSSQLIQWNICIQENEEFTDFFCTQG